MKFAREFKAALLSGDYPEEWCTAAIPYPTLKKCLNKIRAELQDLGLDADSLRQLLKAEAVLSHGDHIPLVKYKLDVSESNVHPHFTIFVDLEDGAVVDASLSPASRAFLQKQAELRRKSVTGTPVCETKDGPTPEVVAIELPNGDQKNAPSGIQVLPVTDEEKGVATATIIATPAPADEPMHEPEHEPTHEDPPKTLQRVEVSLSSDSEFFGLMYEDMTKLERIGLAEQASIVSDVATLGKEVAEVARPERKRHILSGRSHEGKPDKYTSDLRRWRELFELYLDAQVFFSTRERDHGKARSSAEASRQLNWFQEQVQKRGLLQSFQLPTSLVAYQRFLLLNKRLYLNLRFRELNQTAQVKILKKFDKWTALGVSKTFTRALSRRNHDHLVEGMAKDVCARIAEDVVAVVPRLEDYTCPVCLSLAWLPVRLRCNHVFCVRCVIRMQRDNQRFCPMCRGEVVMEANLDSLDPELERFLKLYFRQEAKEKQLANEMERGIELFGEGYKPTSCVLM